MVDAPRSGYVKLHRKLLDWEWVGDPNVLSVFVQILIRVNREPKHWRGIDIPAGAFLTSRDRLAESCGLTEKQVRRALDVLEKGQTISRVRAGLGLLISLQKWEEYQEGPSSEGRKRADDRAESGPNEGRKRAVTREGEKLRSRETELPPVGGPPPADGSGDQNPPAELHWPAWAGDQTKAQWERFKEYKRTHHRFRYKSIETEQAAINTLARYFKTGRECFAALDEAMAKGHKFPVEPTAKFSAPSASGNAVTAAINSAERKDFQMQEHGSEG